MAYAAAPANPPNPAVDPLEYWNFPIASVDPYQINLNRQIELQDAITNLADVRPLYTVTAWNPWDRTVAGMHKLISDGTNKGVQ